MTGGTIDKQGVYTYPDDPDLYPILMARGDGETFFWYGYDDWL